MSVPTTTTSHLSKSLDIAAATFSSPPLSREKEIKGSKDIPYVGRLTSQALILLEQMKQTTSCLMPKTENLHKPGTSSISLPTLRFTALDMYTALNAGLLKCGLIGPEEPYIIGGAACHLLSRLPYADIDLCYHLEKPNFSEPKKISCEFLRKLLEEQHKTSLSLMEVEDFYLYRKKMIVETRDWSSLLGLGDMLDIKFIFQKARRHVSTSDGFMASLTTGRVLCVDGDKFCDESTFMQNLAHLKERRFIVKNPQSVSLLLYRLLHKCTQGFEASSELVEEALKQIISEIDKSKTEKMAEDFFRHQSNHYKHDHMGAWIEMLNFLHIFRQIPSQLDLRSTIPLPVHGEASKDKALHYAAVFAKACLDLASKKRIAHPAILLAKGIHLCPEVYPHLLAYVKGLFFNQWIAKDPHCQAYAFPFIAPTAPPRMHLAYTHEKGTHYLLLGEPPECVMRNFILSKPIVEKLFAAHPELEGLLSPPLLKTPALSSTSSSSSSSSSSTSSSNATDWPRMSNVQIIHTYLSSFEVGPLAVLLSTHFVEGGAKRRFYAFAAEHLPSVFQEAMGEKALASLKQIVPLISLQEELRKLRDNTLDPIILGLMQCLQANCLGADAKQLKETWDNYLEVLQKLTEKESVKKSAAAVPNFYDTMAQSIRMSMHQAQNGEIRRLPVIYDCLMALGDLGAINPKSRQQTLGHFLDVCLSQERLLTLKGLEASTALNFGKKILSTAIELSKKCRTAELIESLQKAFLAALDLLDTSPMEQQAAWLNIAALFNAAIEEKLIQQLYVCGKILSTLIRTQIIPLKYQELILQLADLLQIHSGKLPDIPHQKSCERIGQSIIAFFHQSEPEDKQQAAQQMRLIEMVMHSFAGDDSTEKTQKIFSEFTETWSLLRRTQDAKEKKNLEAFSKLAKVDFKKNWSHVLSLFIPFAARFNLAKADAFLSHVNTQLTPRHHLQVVLWLLKKHLDAQEEKNLLRAFDLFIENGTLFENHIDNLPKDLPLHQALVLCELICSGMSSAEKRQAYGACWKKVFDCLHALLKKSGPQNFELSSEQRLALSSRLLRVFHAIALEPTLEHLVLIESCFIMLLPKKLLALEHYDSTCLLLVQKYAALIEQAQGSSISSSTMSISTPLTSTSTTRELRARCLHWLNEAVNFRRTTTKNLYGDGVSILWQGCRAGIKEAAFKELESVRLLLNAMRLEKDKARAYASEIIALEQQITVRLLDCSEDISHKAAWETFYNLLLSDQFSGDCWNLVIETLFVRVIACRLPHKSRNLEFLAALETLLKMLETKGLIFHFSADNIMCLLPIFMQTGQMSLLTYLWIAIQRNQDFEAPLRKSVQTQFNAHLIKAGRGETEVEFIHFLFRLLKDSAEFNAELYLGILQKIALIPGDLPKELRLLIFSELLPQTITSKYPVEKNTLIQAFRLIVKLILSLAERESDQKVLSEYAHLIKASLDEFKPDGEYAKQPGAKMDFFEIERCQFHISAKVASADKFLWGCDFLLQRLPPASWTQTIQLLFRQFMALPSSEHSEAVIQKLLNTFSNWIEQLSVEIDLAEKLDFLSFLSALCAETADMRYWEIAEYLLGLISVHDAAKYFMAGKLGPRKNKTAAEIAFKLVLRIVDLCQKSDSFRAADQILAITEGVLNKKQHIICNNLSLECLHRWLKSNLDHPEVIKVAFHELRKKLRPHSMPTDKLKIKQVICTLVQEALNISPKWCTAAHYMLNFAAQEGLHLLPDIEGNEKIRADFAEKLCELSSKLIYSIFKYKYRTGFCLFLSQCKIFNKMHNFIFDFEKDSPPILDLFNHIKLVSLQQLLGSNLPTGYEMVFNILTVNSTLPLDAKKQTALFEVFRLLMLELAIVPYIVHQMVHPEGVNTPAETLQVFPGYTSNGYVTLFFPHTKLDEASIKHIIHVSQMLIAMMGESEQHNARLADNAGYKSLGQLIMFLLIIAANERAIFTSEQIDQLCSLAIEGLRFVTENKRHSDHIEYIKAIKNTYALSTFKDDMRALATSAYKVFKLSSAITKLPSELHLCAACPENGFADFPPLEKIPKTTDERFANWSMPRKGEKEAKEASEKTEGEMKSHTAEKAIKPPKKGVFHPEINYVYSCKPALSLQ